MENVFPVDEEFSDKCPPIPKKLMQTIGLIPPPPDAPGAVAMVYERGYRAQCMVCTAPLEENTMLGISGYGIFFTACSGVCFSDYFVMQWLQEVYDDLVDKAKFRGSQGAADTLPLDAPATDSPPEEGDIPSDESEEEEGSNGEVH